MRPCTDHLKREVDRLPPGGFGHPLLSFAEVGNLFPSCVYRRWRANLGDQQEDGERREWNVIAKGAADSFEAAKAAAPFEAGAAS